MRRPERLIFLAGIAVTTAMIGGGAIFHYASLGLILSHYDARGHLVVARRIFDSVTPGWQQIGAIWLPLPHLLNALPVQFDPLFRSGASSVLLSAMSFVVAAVALASMVWRITDSRWAAVAGVSVFVLNPNVLYLQSTPMTEPLLLALTASAVAKLMDWLVDPQVSARGVGIVFAMACLTRYEAWPVTAVAVPLAAWVRWRSGRSVPQSLRDIAPIGLPPLAAAVLFMTFSRVVVGQWFVSSGFFVPDPKYASLLGATLAIREGVLGLSGPVLVAVAAAGLATVIVTGLLDRRRTFAIVALSLTATAALPWLAFLHGHPYRVRYMVPLLAAQALGAGVAAGVIRRAAPAVALGLVMLSIVELGPFAPDAPMVVEAQWDRPHAVGRQTVSNCLSAGYHGETIMASMGSLGHFMQTLAANGFELRDFLHEGNGDIWLAALEGPRPYVGWILIEEDAAGGDLLARATRERPTLLEGFVRRCEGGGVALYQRTPEPDRGPAPVSVSQSTAR